MGDLISPIAKVVAKLRLPHPRCMIKNNAVSVHVQHTQVQLANSVVKMEPRMCRGEGRNIDIAFRVWPAETVSVNHEGNVVADEGYVRNVVQIVGKGQLAESLNIAIDKLHLR